MWTDKRGNFHIINHAYDNHQWENCGTSVASAHFFSANVRTVNKCFARPVNYMRECKCSRNARAQKCRCVCLYVRAYVRACGVCGL
jgi:hypothetical protein